MINLTRGLEPAVLINNKAAWTQALVVEFQKFGCYKDIPDDVKKKVTSPYRHNDIQNELFASSSKKCAFCECIPESGGGYVQVEHFHPKSIYPEECFSWINFLPCCGVCNTNKGTLDTKITQILNPYDENPKDSFYLSFLKILPKDNDVKAINTEKEIELNSGRLINARMNLLAQLQILTEEIRDAIELVIEADTDRKKVKRTNKLREKVESADVYTMPESQHSFFCSEVLKIDAYYLQAKKILEEI